MQVDGGVYVVDYTSHDPTSGAWLDGGQRMATNRNETNQEEQNSPWLGFAKFLFIVFLGVTVFLLAKSMVGHHFFSGGAQNRHDVTGP
jgi:hypothetical protein